MSYENITNLMSRSYDHIKYVFRSEHRWEVLRQLKNQNFTTNELADTLGIQNTNLHKILRDLEEKDLVSKHDKKYSLTSAGHLIVINAMHFLDNYYSVFKLDEFWESHSLENIPYHFLRNMDIWKNAELIKSTGLLYNKPMNTLLRHSGDARRFRVVLPIFSTFHIQTFIDAVYENDGLIDLIVSEEVYDAIEESDIADEFNNAYADGYLRIWIDYENEINMFLTSTDKFYSLSLFYMDGSYDDATLLISTDEKYKKQVDNIFDCYTRKFKEVE